MKYAIEHEVKIRSTGEWAKTAAVARLWMPTPQDTQVDFSVAPLSSRPLSELGCTVNYWNIVLPGIKHITCSYEHSGVPRVPPTTNAFITAALSKDDVLGAVTKKVLSIPLRDKVDNLKPEEQILAIKRHLISNLKYQYPPDARKAEEVLQTLKSDCAGYHAVFIALARSLGIPAVLDFGFRTKSENYHVWAWWFNNASQTWKMEDLNDEQQRAPLLGRIGMTLSTNPNIVPAYPRPISFLQSHLVWVNNLEELKNKGLQIVHSSSWKVTVNG